MIRLRFAAMLILIPAFLHAQDLTLRPALDGWGELQWEESINKAQEVYGFSAERDIILTNDQEIVMRRDQEMQISGIFLDHEATIDFLFDHQDRLKAVKVEFASSSIPEQEYLTGTLEKFYGDSGEKEILSLVTGAPVGTARIWIRESGVLSLKRSRAHCSLLWEKPWSEEFPTALFLTVDDEDTEEALYLINGGHDLEASYPIFEDEAGQIALAGILDYGLMFYLQCPDNTSYEGIVRALIKQKAPLYFFPEQILEQPPFRDWE